MRPPQLKTVAEKVWGCPACSATFAYDAYEGTPIDKMRSIQADYAKHFSEHSGEDVGENLQAVQEPLAVEDPKAS